ncbi:hypothetical protein [Deinococcus arenicola]|uniref:Vitamin K epoxide reductase domain-containing protein n=1 Tax=Deinococcus arenicola TaxID=2994950 RepID=A0ABU4DM61_9DEIO|nr:hypothetical protein [Deinococcus sp. ZS9-10]MDV6373516.1 hypothetical protein [Deinococcus sp. ZS9-10]
MKSRLAQAVRVYVLALICTLLSQFHSQTTYVPTQPCSPGATCAAAVRESGWPLPWIRVAVSPADEPLDLAFSGLNPKVALLADLAFYSLLFVLIGQVLRTTERWRTRS